MKKILSAVLAASMIASMATMSFALTDQEIADRKADSVSETGYLYNVGEDDSNVMTPFTRDDIVENGDMVRYGETIYFPVLTAKTNGQEYEKYVFETDAMKSVSIKQKWERGSKSIKNIEIIKKKMLVMRDVDKTQDDIEVSKGNQQKYFFFVAMTLNPSTSDDITDINGTITLRKSSGDFAFDDNEIKFNVNLEAGYEETPIADGVGKEYNKYAFEENTEEYIEFAAADGTYFVVDTCDQDDLVAKADTKVNTALTAKYPDAYLDFFNGYGLTFNKIGEMRLYSEKGKYLYELKNDELVAVKNTFDEYEDTFVFKTRTIGNYVISDTELKLTSGSTSSTPSGSDSSSTTTTPSVPTKPNPGTGANA